MSSDTASGFRASKLTPEEMADARRLDAKFAELKASTGMTKAQFAKEFKVPGGASMISQNTSGTRPISLAQAKAYMRGFGCTLEEISPSLAAQLPAKASLPSQLAARLAAADEPTRKLVELALSAEDAAALDNLPPSVRGLHRLIALAKQQIADELGLGGSTTTPPPTPAIETGAFAGKPPASAPPEKRGDTAKFFKP